ncbi:hypothetical protein SAMN04487766_10128 [Actinomyces ruminicola]|uniref:Uncharacterized protein n=1 Tax=Actinomyces ruminicola TaxID=332524 RepID=A0A1G9RJ99_9ACTO|nr:hypothetical protein SAMN04487766_10128 [Actinomyces ruminicola]
MWLCEWFGSQVGLDIVGSRMAKAPADPDALFAWHGDALTDGQVTRHDHPRTGTRSTERDDKTGSSGLWVLPAWWVVCARAPPPRGGMSEFGTKTVGDRRGRF